MDPTSTWLDEGEFDSKGRFTLDFKQMASGYRHLSKKDPNAFLRRLAQAAFRAQASHLHFKILYDRMVVTIETEHIGDFEEATQALLQQEESKGAAQLHFRTALLCMLAEEPKGLWVTTFSPQGRRRYDLLSATRDRGGAIQGLGGVRVEYLFRSTGFWQKLTGFLGKRVGWSRFLYSHLGCSELPVSLDGRRIRNDRWLLGAQRILGASRNLEEPSSFRLAVKKGEKLEELPEGFISPSKRFTIPSPEELEFCLVQFDSPQSAPSSLRSLAPLYLPLGFNQAPKPCALVFGIEDSLGKAGVLYPVTDGVLISPLPVEDWSAGRFAYVDCSHLALDADGLQPVKNREFFELVRRVGERIQQLTVLKTQCIETPGWGLFFRRLLGDSAQEP